MPAHTQITRPNSPLPLWTGSTSVPYGDPWILRLAWGLLLAVLVSGCYSLKGYSISPEAKTYYVGNFKVNALSAPPAINQTFTESLKDKIARESRLKYSDQEPDMEFNGTIQS